jgi:dienelactone hydrolase
MVGMNTQDVAYEADGLQMIGHLAWTASEPRPAVLVFTDAGGLGEHAKARAERLASEFGYAAMACDLYRQQEVLRDFSEVQRRLQAIRTSATKVRARTANALAALLARPEVYPSRVAAIGFCFGETTLTYELKLTGADIKAAIGFGEALRECVPGSEHIGEPKIGKYLCLLWKRTANSRYARH